ncbi:MAG TPA: TonB-dependent receptor [Rhizomicrobium sp.]
MTTRIFRVLLAGSALAVIFGAQALAQVTAGVETVVVTGTRIPRPETDLPNPVATIGSEQIENSGMTNLTDVLQRIPALTGSLGDYQTSGYNTPAAADGSSLGGLNLLDLRNLGYVRTLVLVDGHRMVSESTGSSAVDVDSIPISLINRVEVVTGGSSAVYGADGVSGVVNFVMKHDLDGVYARAQYGTSQDGGGEKYLGALAVGHNFDNDKGNVTLAVEDSRQTHLFFTERDFTSLGGRFFFVPNPDNPDGSIRNLPANIPSNDVQFIYSAPTGAIDIAMPRRTGRFQFDGFPDHVGNGADFIPGIDLGNGSAIGSSGMPYVNDLEADYQPTENRRIVQLMSTYEFSPSLKLYGEFKYSHVDTQSLNIAPFDDDIMITAQNPFLPPELAALIAASPLGEAALSEDYLAMREAERVERNTYRGVLDATGELPSPSFLQNFRYDASFVYGRTSIDDFNLRNRNIDRFAAALDSVIDPATGKPTCRSNLNPGATPPTLNDYANFYGKDANYFSDTSNLFSADDFGLTFTPGPNSGCVPFNPFDPHFNNAASIAWTTQNTVTTGSVSEEVLNGYVSADVQQFQDWGFAKPLSIVAGAEYRRESSRSTPDPLTEVPGLYWYGGTLPVSGSFHVYEAFGEMSLPILMDRPFAKELTFDAAGRVSKYSTAGSNQSWKLGLVYSPIEGLKLRGTDAVAVRAPNIGELFAPKQNLFSFINDPCDFHYIGQGTPFRAANCQAIEDAVLGPGKYVAGESSTQTDQTTPTSVSGNPLLSPETARTLTFGIVLQPDFLPGFVGTVDWYRVKIVDAIQAPSGQDVSNECVDLSTIDNPFCANVMRTPSGRFPGSISLVNTGQINVAVYSTQGIDFTADYQVDLKDWFEANYGSLDFHLIGNHLDTIKTTPLPGEQPIKSENLLYGGADQLTPTPYWTANIDMVWHLAPWTVDYNVDWYNGVLISPDRQTVKSEPNYVLHKYLHTDARNFHSIQIAYDVSDSVNLYFGVQNLWYQKPTLGQDGYPVNPLGRFFYGGVRVNMDRIPGL